MPALYIHLPFCARKCAYCDFASWAGREGDEQRYMLALESEMAQAAKGYGKMPVETLFIGGGTPSFLPADAVMRLVAMARARFDLAPDAEITVEANPGTVDRNKLRDYRDAGVNRLSLGMQSASDRLLGLLGRIHTHEQTKEAVELVRAAGFTNFNLDLMYALPTQTVAEWVDTVKEALRLGAPHLSLYSLIVEDGTPIKAQIGRGELPAPDDETALTMQHAAARMLAKRGLNRYEISNYARAGYECRHNIAYWRRGDYLGLGCAAHSLMNGRRFANTDSLDAYLAGEREISSETLDERAVREETVMLGTRMTAGIPMGALAGREAKVESLCAAGFATVRAGRFALTERGMDVQDAIVLDLV